MSQMLSGILVSNKKEQITDINNSISKGLCWDKEAKHKGYMLHKSFIWHSGKDKSVGTKTKSVTSREQQEETDDNGAWGNFWGDRKMLIGMVVTKPYTFVNLIKLYT